MRLLPCPRGSLCLLPTTSDGVLMTSQTEECASSKSQIFHLLSQHISATNSCMLGSPGKEVSAEEFTMPGAWSGESKRATAEGGRRKENRQRKLPSCTARSTTAPEDALEASGTTLVPHSYPDLDQNGQTLILFNWSVISWALPKERVGQTALQLMKV